MPVSEQHKGIGEWSIQFKDGTPRAVREACWHPHSHVVITPAWVDSRIMSDSDILGAARYTGVLLRRSAYSLFGAGLAWWIGDSDDQGSLLTSDLTLTAATNEEVYEAILNGHLTLGDHPSAGNHTATYPKGVSRRTILDSYVPSREWRVNADLSFDVGTATGIERIFFSPTVMLTPGGGGRYGGGLNAELTILDAEANVDVDWVQHAHIVIFEGRGGTSTSSTGATSYLDPLGNAYTRVVKLGSDAVQPGSQSTFSSYYAGEFQDEGGREEVSVAIREEGVEQFIRPGEKVYVWDQLGGVSDYTSSVPVAGQETHPAIMQVIRLDWPVRAGHGVYHRVWHSGDADPTWTDLTPYVEFEDPVSASIEVISRGDRNRWSPTNSTSRGDLVAQQADRFRAAPWDDYTPTWGSTGTAPSLGNGTLVGYWRRDGTTLHFGGQLTIGSTSTLGTGGWTFSLPSGVTATSTRRQSCSASARDVGAALAFSVTGDIGASSSTVQFGSDRHSASSGFYTGDGVPHAWASGDTLAWSGTIETTP